MKYLLNLGIRTVRQQGTQLFKTRGSKINIGFESVILQKNIFAAHPDVASRNLTNSRKMDHITAVLKPLLWLPVSQRIKFLSLVDKSLNDLGPKDMSDASDMV